MGTVIGVLGLVIVVVVFAFGAALSDGFDCTTTTSDSGTSFECD